VLAVRGDGKTSVLLINHHPEGPQDVVATVHFTGLARGRKMLNTYRLDEQRKWDEHELELLRVERREVDTYPHYRCQVYCPAESATLVASKQL
jgi:hypothetical protein